MDDTKLSLLLGTLITTVAVQAGQIAQLRGATSREARAAAIDQYTRLLAASGASEPGQMTQFLSLVVREFPSQNH
ncbi:hypothetical protein DKM44_12930 [Deinococcus irradiatisoli]|uniref:Uncharacterized protein n=1 Tax=Deinococcus irradiatisoli TaxID=2202254 RepID=A0A2Z3JGB3_9DEIO|nr:hypothetical protein [Deinococcus irradiatisoli]AWN24025.1 hypothetical protein DKM44_12930 [Deinococcus irradiatisoli]